MSTSFAGPCRLCKTATMYELSSMGPEFCKRCCAGIQIVGNSSQYENIAPDRYAALVIECGSVAVMLPANIAEPFNAWKYRVSRAVNIRRSGRPIPEFLRKPLSKDALEAYARGRSDADFIAAQPPVAAVVAVPGAKKIKVARAVERKAPALKLWQ